MFKLLLVASLISVPAFADRVERAGQVDGSDRDASSTLFCTATAMRPKGVGEDRAQAISYTCTLGAKISTAPLSEQVKEAGKDHRDSLKK